MLRQKKIVAQAADLFIKCGIRSISMDDIAKARAISKKTLYQQVQNKENLIALVADDLLSTFSPQFFIESHQPVEEPQEQLRKIAMYILIFTQENHHFLHELKAHYPAIWTIFDTQQKEIILNAILPLYHILVAGNSLNEQINHATFFYLFTHACRLKGYESTSEEDWICHRDLLDILIDGLLR